MGRDPNIFESEHSFFSLDQFSLIPTYIMENITYLVFMLLQKKMYDKVDMKMKLELSIFVCSIMFSNFKQIQRIFLLYKKK